jgi:hypothetical protein
LVRTPRDGLKWKFFMMTQNKPCDCSLNTLTTQPDTASVPTRKQQLTIEFMYLDREVCAPCRLTETTLEAALVDASGWLEAVGVEVFLNKIQIRSLEQALALDFSLSPTIRVNGVDIQPDSQESQCAGCSEISGIRTDCRVWLYQGHVYETPPKAMLLDALLEAACHSSGVSPVREPVSDRARDNLKRFFDATRERAAETQNDKASVKETACCAPVSSGSTACCGAKEAS